ncbi:hypothetical protein SprV_0501880100 [Sparganum proliferum]
MAAQRSIGFPKQTLRTGVRDHEQATNYQAETGSAYDLSSPNAPSSLSTMTCIYGQLLFALVCISVNDQIMQAAAIPVLPEDVTHRKRFMPLLNIVECMKLRNEYSAVCFPGAD